MKPASPRNALLGAIGSLGAAAFLYFFTLTFHAPAWVERFAADFIGQEVSKQVDQAVDSLGPPGGEQALSRLASAMYARNQQEIERRRELLRNRVHERMAEALDRVRDLDCACRARWAEWVEGHHDARILLLEQENRTLEDFIQGAYARVVTDLARDIRIFTGTNAFLFLLLLAAAFAKPRATAQLFVPGVLLATATLVCSWFYLFEQNWLLTIIHGDYLGAGYLAYLGLVFAFLCDIFLNRARVATELVNAFLGTIGKAATAVPC